MACRDNTSAAPVDNHFRFCVEEMKLDFRGERLEEFDTCFAGQLRGWLTHPHNTPRDRGSGGFPRNQSNNLSFGKSPNAFNPTAVLGKIYRDRFVPYLSFIRVHHEHQSQPDGMPFGPAGRKVGVSHNS